MTGTDPAFFDTLYARDPDPWRFETSAYEHAKYQATLDSLPPRRFESALEVGCSVGVLTRRLADRCTRVLGLDISEAPLAAARARCIDRPGATFARATVPADWPPGRFDLILFSEVLYYLDPPAIRTAARHATASLTPNGLILLVNWTGETGTPLTGRQAAALFIEAAALPTRSTAHEAFEIDAIPG